MDRALVLSLLLAACGAPAGGDPPPVPAPAPAAAPAPEPLAPVPSDPPDPREACGQILVVAHTGATEPAEGTTRDPAAAQALAGQLRARLQAGEPFMDLAASQSDDRSKERRGGIGTHLREAWPERHAAVADAIFALRVGEVGGPLEAPYGTTLVRRCAIEKVDTSHILVRYTGAQNAKPEVKRSKEEARARAEALRARVAGGEDFAAVAKAESEDGSAADGGRLGPVGRGMFAPAYEEAAFALRPGETSAVVETGFGFHIIHREG